MSGRLKSVLYFIFTGDAGSGSFGATETDCEDPSTNTAYPRRCDLIESLNLKTKTLRSSARRGQRMTLTSSFSRGHTTSRGSIAEGKSFVDALKSHTQVPWFHTLGDRDINGALADDYIDFLGASSLAFDLEQIRYILLDSANGGLKSPTGY